MSKPIALSDSDMDHVYAACRPLAPDRRDGFLQALAAELRGRENLSPFFQKMGREIF
jgi:hypothetical protein